MHRPCLLRGWPLVESNPWSKEWQDLGDAELLEKAAMFAGDISMKFFQASNEVWYKSGNSPVSEADQQVDEFLRETFVKLRPDYGWLSEETDDDPARLGKQKVVVVDPIDGTRGFIDGRVEWCISIAVVEDGRPVEAVLFCPALARMYQASAGGGAKENGIPIKTAPARQLPKLTGSKKLIQTIRENMSDKFEVTDFVPSLAYRIAMVATGELDGAFARPGASEWDLAAADLILSEAGGKITNIAGEILSYNRPNVNSPALVAASCDCHANILELAKASGILQ